MIVTISVLIVATVLLVAFRLAPKAAPAALVYRTTPDRPCGFGYRMAWLAVRTTETERLAQNLGLVHCEPSAWQTGIGVVYDRRLSDERVFVTPPVDGWTFVVGLSLPHPMGPIFVDKATPLLLQLSRDFPEVQYYFSYPPIDHHAWARVTDGKLVRAFAIGDEGIIWNKGKPTREEQSLGLKLFELRGVRGRKGDAGGEIILYPTEEHVMRLAAQWSLDPTALDKSPDVRPGLGIVGHTPPAWRTERRRKAA